MDRNKPLPRCIIGGSKSLSARRAWIEILVPRLTDMSDAVALRKESVDRNPSDCPRLCGRPTSLSARRAWIEIVPESDGCLAMQCRSPQGERG